jgi:hypothetical protein
MTGRKGLTWVTALTIASLLLGGGALNALADGHGGGGSGGSGRGGSEHQQQQLPKPAAVQDADNAPRTTQGRDDDGKHGNGGDTSNASAATNVSNSTAAVSNRSKDEHGDGNTNVNRDNNNRGNDNLNRDNNDNRDNGNLKRDNNNRDDDNLNRDNNRDNDDQDEDLVTPPARVTDEDRPGLGCGDEHHEHLGAPGDPGVMCPARDNDGDDDAATNAAAATDDDN